MRRIPALFFPLILVIVPLAAGQSLPVSNASFETGTLPFNGGGAYSNVLPNSSFPVGGTLSGWTASSTTANAAAGSFAPTLGGSNWTAPWWNGSNIGYLQVFAVGTVSLSQNLASSLQNSTTYSLSAQLGRRSGFGFSYSMQLWAGSTLLSSTNRLTLADYSSGVYGLLYNSGPNNPAQGQPLKIVFSISSSGGGVEIFFDNVSLTGKSDPFVTLDMSHDLVNLGIASSNMVPNQPSLNAGPLFRLGVNYAATHGFGRVIADQGAYYFLSLQTPNAHVQLDGNTSTPVNNITIDFQNSDLVFTHPLQYGIIFWMNTNVVVQNFTADYQPLPYTQLRVVAVDTPQAQIQYSVEPGWQNPSAFNSAQPSPGTGGVPIEVHIFRNGRPALDTRRMEAQTPFAGNQFKIIPNYGFDPTPANMAKIRPGDIAVVAMRQFGEPLVAYRCRGCTFRNITVYSAASAALDVTHSESMIWERVYSVPKPGTDRLISTFGFGLQANGPNNQVRLSRAIRTLDGGFALYTWATGEVESQQSLRTFTIAGNCCALGQGVTIANGSPVVFQRRSDGAVLGSAVVVSQSGSVNVYNPNHLSYTFDRDLPGNFVGAVMYTTDVNQRGGGSLIERNNVQDKGCCYGMDIWGWAGSTVRGNYIHRVGYAGIGGIQSLMSTSWTTPPLTDMTFRNNVLDGTNMTPDWWLNQLAGIAIVTVRPDQNGGPDLIPAGSVHQNITMIDNFIADPGRYAIWIGNTLGGNVSGNLLLHPNERRDPLTSHPPVTDSTEPLVVYATSSGITTADNTVDQVAGAMFVTDTQYRELAAYAPGSTIRLNAYGLGTLSNLTVALTDADGITSSVSIVNSTTHAVDITVPPNAGLGGAYLTATSGSAKSFGSLFLDSQDNIPAVNGCIYEVSVPTTSVAATAGSFPALVVTQAGCAYQALATDPFVTVGGQGTGTGVLSVGFALNGGAARTTTIEIAGQPIKVTQESAVAPVSVAPAFGSGLTQTFTALYSDTNGFGDIDTAMLNVNPSSSLANGCVVKYVRASNQLFLMNDAGTTWIGPAIPGSVGTLQNTQCDLDPQASSTSSAVNDLTVRYALIFATSFLGPKSVFMNVSNANVSSGWQARGTWDVGLKKTGGQLTSQ